MQESQTRMRLKTWPGIRGRPLPFVLLQHTVNDDESHYDLMLVLRPGRKLWDFERPRPPRRSQAVIQWRTHGLHRRRYLDYEGDIGNGRGSVMRADTGYYLVQKRRGILVLSISGSLLYGVYQLCRHGYGRHVWIRISEPAVVTELFPSPANSKDRREI